MDSFLLSCLGDVLPLKLNLALLHPARQRVSSGFWAAAWAEPSCILEAPQLLSYWVVLMAADLRPCCFWDRDVHGRHSLLTVFYTAGRLLLHCICLGFSKGTSFFQLILATEYEESSICHLFQNAYHILAEEERGLPMPKYVSWYQDSNETLVGNSDLSLF